MIDLTPDLIMKDDGVTNVILSDGNIFLNASCMFIEFRDVIHATPFVFLEVIKDNGYFNRIFDASEILKMNESDLFYWYVNRKHQNPLLDLPMTDEALRSFINENNEVDEERRIKWCNDFLNKEIAQESLHEIYDYVGSLNFYYILFNIKTRCTFLNNIIVYTEDYNPNVEKKLNIEFDNSIRVVHGDLKEALKLTPTDTTYVFSDIKKMLVLRDTNKLNYSSVIIADRFNYNYKDVDSEDTIIDIDEEFKDNIYKIDFFDNTHE